MKKQTIILFIITSILMLLGLYFIILKPIDNTKAKITNKITRSATYEVYLKDNPYYDNNPVKNNIYASNSIDYINIYFNYNNPNNNYTYNITAKIKGNINNNLIWTKNFILKENQATNNKIKDNITINYDSYNNLVNSYENTYNLILDATLNISLNIKYNNKTDSINIDIPLTKTTTSIISNYEPTTINITNIKNITYINYIIGTLFIFISLILIYIKTNQKNTPKEKYKNIKKRILKEYKELIINVNNEPNINNLKLLKVFNINDLIDVAEQNSTHIIFYESNNQSNFYVIINNYVYLYILK